ncbi:hypothetical protein [Priestia megaterium]|uniref:hypothetical protein n=1 Tax=Priestia megaterium TaxID=1404 RepID=UPI00319DDAEA
MVNIVSSVSFLLAGDWRARRRLLWEQRQPAESEALHGNQLRCNKQSSSSISFVRLKIEFI